MHDFICLEKRHIKGFEGMDVVIYNTIYIVLILLIKFTTLKRVRMPHRLEAKPKWIRH